MPTIVDIPHPSPFGYLSSLWSYISAFISPCVSLSLLTVFIADKYKLAFTFTNCSDFFCSYVTLLLYKFNVGYLCNKKHWFRFTA